MGYVRPVDLLMRIGILSHADYDRWRFGKVSYLEKVCQANLNKLSTVLKTLERVARECGWKPSSTVYKQLGAKGKKTPLQFGKTKQPVVEKKYATHYVSKPKLPKSILMSESGT